MKDTMKVDKPLLSVKNDFVFKLIFGRQNHKNPLISFLSAVMGLSKSNFKDIQILNTELLREFKEDKKGILDVRIKTLEGEQIDIEIQILPTAFMAERSLFYWSKMYTSQIKSGDTYDKLRKCVTINITDFVCTPVNRVHTNFHITEDQSKYQLTDVLEIHFLEMPKLLDKTIENTDDPIIQWIQFINSKSEGVLKMLTEKNKDIKEAYDYLKIISQDEKARMEYEAREAELHDQMTRMKSALERGKKENSIKIVKNMLRMEIDTEKIAEATEMTIDEILRIKDKLE